MKKVILMNELTIKEIKKILEKISELEDPRLQDFKKDNRKGVKNAIIQWEKAIRKKEKLLMDYERMSDYERSAYAQGARIIAGIDEVGRGPLAGPVLAAAVILDPDNPIIGLNDSKKLSTSQKTLLYNEIHEKALGIGVGMVEANVIDEINIYQASKLAMVKAVKELDSMPDFLLIDAMKLPLQLPQESIIKGDAKSISIAAASIIAKVERDRLMEEYHLKYPGYGFDQNAGYGTKQHLLGLDKKGITPIHRLSFAPVKERLSI